MSRRLLTSRSSRSASWWMERSSSPRVSWSSCSPLSSRLLDAPVMVASGVRRSWETELKSEFRSRSASARTSARCASSASCARSMASAIWFANVSSWWSCSGLSADRGAAGLNPSTPDRPPRSDERQVEGPRARQGRRPESRQLPVLVDPLRDPELARVQRERRAGSSAAPRRDPSRPGAGRRAGRETPRRCGAGRSRAGCRRPASWPARGSSRRARRSAARAAVPRPPGRGSAP